MEKSSEQVDEVLKREPANADAQVLRASLLMRQEKQDDAITLLQQVLEANPGQAGASILLASIYEKQDKGDEAVRSARGGGHGECR